MEIGWSNRALVTRGIPCGSEVQHRGGRIDRLIPGVGSHPLEVLIGPKPVYFLTYKRFRLNSPVSCSDLGCGRLVAIHPFTEEVICRDSSLASGHRAWHGAHNRSRC